MTESTATNTGATREERVLRRWLGVRSGSLIALLAFALPVLAFAVPNCSSGPTPISGDIHGYELVVGGTVEANEGNSRSLDGAADRDDGHVDPVPAAIMVVVLLAAVLALSFRPLRPPAGRTITAAGVVATLAVTAWAAIPASLESRLVYEEPFTIWRPGGVVIFAGLIWAQLASHLDAIAGSVGDAKILISANLAYVAFVFLSVGGEASGPAVMGLVFVGLNLIVFSIKWFVRRRRLVQVKAEAS